MLMDLGSEAFRNKQAGSKRPENVGGQTSTHYLFYKKKLKGIAFLSVEKSFTQIHHEK